MEKSVYLCKICNKIYANQNSLCNHNRKFHKKSCDHDNNNCKQDCKQDCKQECKHNGNIKFNCKFCEKQYNHRQSKYRHEITCKSKNANPENIDRNTIKEEIKNQLFNVLKLAKIRNYKNYRFL